MIAEHTLRAEVQFVKKHQSKYFACDNKFNKELSAHDFKDKRGFFSPQLNHKINVYSAMNVSSMSTVLRIQRLTWEHMTI